MKIKIIHIQLLPLLSGVQKVTLEELAFLSKDKYDRIVICKDHGEFTKQLQLMGVRVILVPQLTRDISLKNDLFALFRLIKIIREEAPNIIHTHSSKTGILGRVAGFLCGVDAIVHTVHGFAYSAENRKVFKFFYKIVEKLAAKITDLMIVLNKSDEKYAINELKVFKEKLLYLPNGVDTSIYAPAKPDQKNILRKKILNLNSDKTNVIGMVARLWPQKDPRCFVSAAILVAELYPNTCFVLVGDGELKNELEKIVSRYKMENAFVFLGWRSDVQDILKCLDILVLSSRWEGMPLILLEAMASDVPIIASDIPGNNDLITDGINGRLFPVGNDKKLSEIIMEMIVDKKGCKKLFRINARSKLEQNHKILDRIKKINNAYLRVLNSDKDENI